MAEKRRDARWLSAQPRATRDRPGDAVPRRQTRMLKGAGAGFFLAGLFFIFLTALLPPRATAGDLGAIADTLENMADVSRAAERAGESMKNAMEGRGPAYPDYYYPERRRAREMAEICGTSESRIIRLRHKGYSWDEIARRYRVAPGRWVHDQGLHNGYDRRHWKEKGHRKYRRHHGDDD